MTCRRWTRTTTADTWEQVKVDDKPQTLLLEQVTASRDGVSLQAITVTRRYPDTAFPTIKKKTRADMQPLEVADLYVSELRKRYGLERLRVLSNKPAQINGKQGFELVMEFKNDDGLRLRIVSNGFVDKTGFYTINYRAPVFYYYDRDYSDYAKLVRSFRQSKGAFIRRRKFRAGRSFFGPDDLRVPVLEAGDAEVAARSFNSARRLSEAACRPCRAGRR